MFILKKDIAAILAVILMLVLGGCSQLNCCLSFPVGGSKNTVHYMVIGFGIISVPKSEKEIALLATRVQSLGVSVADQPGLRLGIGYSSGTIVAVPDGAEDVRVEVSQKPGGPLTVETQKATLIAR